MPICLLGVDMEIKIIMCKGLPGSGKSTWAKQMSRNNQQYVRVNKDDIREMIGYTRHRENMVLNIRDAIVTNALLVQKKNIIVDDTNFHPKHETRLRELAGLCHAGFEIKMFDTPLKECIENDLKRAKSVGEKVIRKMHDEFLVTKQVAPKWDNGKECAIICDLDGTLALHDGRSPYDTGKCDTDILCNEVASILTNMVGHIIFVSGRDEQFREMTKAWLDKNFTGKPYELYMRPLSDRREDSIVKEELFNTYIKGRFNIRFVLDDRNRVVNMWRRIGLKCLQVAEGDF